MSTSLKVKEMFPALDNFFKPWNDWFENNGIFHKVPTVPAVNIKDEKEKYQVSLAIPGMKKEDFSIDIEDDILTISASSEKEKEEKEEKYTRKEYSYSSFSRSFTLPDEVIADKVEAKYNDGILLIDLPKKEDAGPVNSKKIKIN